MKKIIYKLGFLLVAFAFFSACTSPEAETNYTPANYEYPVAIGLTSNNITNSSFDFTYANSGDGEGYYVVVEGGSPAPSNEDVFNGSAAGQIASGNFALDGNPVVITVDDDLCDGSGFDVYAVQFTSDSFLSPSPTSLTVNTVGNANIAGTYDAVTNGFNGWFGIDVVDDLGTVSITDNGDGSFSFDDVTAGWYSTYYGGYGATEQFGTFPSIPCNDIVSNFASQFNGCCGDVIVVTGTINFDGTITINWSNTFFGDVSEIVLTKQ